MVTSRIKKRDMVYFNGLMDVCIRETGKMANNMEEEFCLIRKETKWRLNGMMANESNKLPLKETKMKMHDIKQYL